MVSHTFPGIAPVVISTKSFDQRFDKFSSSEGYSVARDDAAIGVANDYIILRIRNLPAAAKTLFIEKVLFSVDVATVYKISQPVTPGATGTGTVATPQVKKAGQAASIATVNYIDTAIAPALPNLYAGRLVANQLQEIFLGVVLPADSSIDMGAQMPATTQKYQIAAEWYEE